MTRVLVTVEDEKVIADAIAKYGKRDVCLALDDSVANRYKLEAYGLDRYALVGSDADHSLFAEVIGKTTPKPKKKAPVKKDVPIEVDIEAVVDEQSKKVQ